MAAGRRCWNSLLPWFSKRWRWNSETEIYVFPRLFSRQKPTSSKQASGTGTSSLCLCCLKIEVTSGSNLWKFNVKKSRAASTGGTSSIVIWHFDYQARFEGDFCVEKLSPFIEKKSAMFFCCCSCVCDLDDLFFTRRGEPTNNYFAVAKQFQNWIWLICCTMNETL